MRPHKGDGEGQGERDREAEREEVERVELQTVRAVFFRHDRSREQLGA